MKFFKSVLKEVEFYEDENVRKKIREKDREKRKKNRINKSIEIIKKVIICK